MILFWLMFLICPLVTALIYRAGYLRGLCGPEGFNQFALAVLSIAWPFGLVALVLGITLALLGFIGIWVIDIWVWVATGKWPEKPVVQARKKR